MGNHGPVREAPLRSEFAARENDDHLVTPRPQTIIRWPAGELVAFAVDLKLTELRFHRGTKLSERLDRNRAHQQFILSEQLFEVATISTPPGPIESVHHDFNYVLFFRPSPLDQSPFAGELRYAVAPPWRSVISR